MLRGPNFAGTEQLCAAVGPYCRVIASGGVTAPRDVVRLRELNKGNLAGAIVGKALYEGRTTLGEMLAAARA
jgi:phosphoribosylformimino-5-aminoimidazole carboxamide ribonucleotide (ProFAR) isomerase